MTEQAVHDRLREVMADYGVDEGDAIRRYLAQELALWRAHQRRDRLAYEGPQGFVLTHGVEWQSPPALPDGFEYMEAKNCYGNAATLALQDDRLTYVEGYAMGRFFPIPHAWVVDRAGVVIDPTWIDYDDDTVKRGEWSYVGVPFTSRWLVEQITRNGTYGLLQQWESGYRMLKRPLPKRAVPQRYLQQVFQA